jgi:hypothetical protein
MAGAFDSRLSVDFSQRAAWLADCSAGESRAVNKAMLAMTTRSLDQPVKPRRDAESIVTLLVGTLHASQTEQKRAAKRPAILVIHTLMRCSTICLITSPNRPATGQRSRLPSSVVAARPRRRYRPQIGTRRREHQADPLSRVRSGSPTATFRRNPSDESLSPVVRPKTYRFRRKEIILGQTQPFMARRTGHGR